MVSFIHVVELQSLIYIEIVKEHEKKSWMAMAPVALRLRGPCKSAVVFQMQMKTYDNMQRSRDRWEVSKWGAEQRWEQVRWGSGGVPQKTLWGPVLYIVGKRPFMKRLATLRPYLFTVRFRKDFNRFEKRQYNGQQNYQLFLYFFSQKPFTTKGLSK